jgi:hypothetical protein
LIADPITAFGKKKSLNPDQPKQEGNLVQRLKMEVKAAPQSKLSPLEPYMTPRDQTRERVQSEIYRQQRLRESGGLTSYFTDSQSMDKVLPRLHGKSGNTPTREFRGPIF